MEDEDIQAHLVDLERREMKESARMSFIQVAETMQVVRELKGAFDCWASKAAWTMPLDAQRGLPQPQHSLLLLRPRHVRGDEAST
jgi:hypothetical protein